MNIIAAEPIGAGQLVSLVGNTGTACRWKPGRAAIGYCPRNVSEGETFELGEGRWSGKHGLYEWPDSVTDVPAKGGIVGG